jgi:dipeptidyl aminopeptidase/acylaminoacyl peptidase
MYRLKIPVLENEPEKIFQPEEGLFSLGPLSENEKYATLLQIHGNMHQEIWILDLETKKASPLTFEISSGQKYRWLVVRWTDEETMLVATDMESDKTYMAYLSITQEFNKLELPNNEKYELSDFAWNWKTPYTFFSYNQEGYSKLYKAKFEKDRAREIEEVKLPIDGVIISGDNRTFNSGMSLSPEGDKLAITLSSSVSPTNIWIINLEITQTWKATNVSTGGIDINSFVTTSLNGFESFDGLKVPYFKFIPKGEKPANGWSTILIIHGGPEGQARPAFSPEIQFYLSSGFGVIVPNIRGSAGYGRTYLDLDNIEKRLDSILDIKHLALHLKDDNEINSEKLIIYGGSYGGFAVLSAMTEHPELWKAGVDIVGISNFVTFLQNTAPWRRKLREEEYGSLENDMETLIKISPIHKVDKIIAPLFIIQGDNDERVPLSESIQMYEILKKKGTPVKLLRYDDEGHGLAKRKNRIDAYSQVVSWLKEIISS